MKASLCDSAVTTQQLCKRVSFFSKERTCATNKRLNTSVKKWTKENATTTVFKMWKDETWFQEKNKTGTQNRPFARSRCTCVQGYIEGNNTDYPEAVGGRPQSMSMRHRFPFYVKENLLSRYAVLFEIK